MTTRIYAGWTGLLVALLAAAPTPAQMLPSGTLTVAGDSNVRSWTCSTTTFGGSLELADQGALTPDRLGEAVRSLDIRIPVARLDCNNNTMNDHMWDALERDRQPEIRYRMTGYTVIPTSSETAVVDLRGELTIAGTTRPHAVRLTARTLEEGAIRVLGDSPIRMTEFGVEPPRAMLGALRVRDDVMVRIDLRLDAPGASK